MPPGHNNKETMLEDRVKITEKRNEKEVMVKETITAKRGKEGMESMKAGVGIGQTIKRIVVYKFNNVCQ